MFFDKKIFIDIGLQRVNLYVLFLSKTFVLLKYQEVIKYFMQKISIKHTKNIEGVFKLKDLRSN